LWRAERTESGEWTTVPREIGLVWGAIQPRHSFKLSPAGDDDGDELEDEKIRKGFEGSDASHSSYEASSLE